MSFSREEIFGLGFVAGSLAISGVSSIFNNPRESKVSTDNTTYTYIDEASRVKTVVRSDKSPLTTSHIDSFRIANDPNTFLVTARDSEQMDQAIEYINAHCKDAEILQIRSQYGLLGKLVRVQDGSCLKP